jgi:hypothetical protein
VSSPFYFELQGPEKRIEKQSKNKKYDGNVEFPNETKQTFDFLHSSKLANR